MPNPFPPFPPKDADALGYMQSMSNGITLSPSTYQLSSSDASAIALAVQEFADARAIAINPATRTAGSVLTKDQKRVSAEQICRQYAILIKYNAGISDAAKVDIGIAPPNPVRNPVTAPGTNPLLNVIAATPGTHTVRYADSMTPASKSKPIGVMQLQLFVHVADEPTLNADEALLHGCYTRNPVAVGFSQDDDGKLATYFARWITRKGEIGPWSLPVTMRIAA